MFSTVPCSSRTKPGYVQETSWFRFSQFEIILWQQAFLSPICMEQVGFFNKHISFEEKEPKLLLIIYLRCDKYFLGFGRDFSFSSSWHFLSSSSLLILNSSSISAISSELKASWSTLLQVLEEFPRKLSVKRIFKTCKSTALSQLHSWTHYYQICMRTVCMKETSKAWILFLPFDFAPTWKPSTGS